MSEKTLKFGDIVVNKKDDVIRPLCIILPQMSGYIKYFDNDGKDM